MKDLLQNEKNRIGIPTHFQAHLVFANTQAKIKNQKSLHFANAQTNILTLRNDFKNIK